MSARTLAATGAAVTAAAVAGGLASAGADDPWYRQLRKPAFQPPGAAFPIVWTGLYAAIATGSARTLDELSATGRRDEATAFAGALGANLALNAGWTWLFFRTRRPWLATAESAVLTASSVDLVRRAARADTAAAALLAPYAAWTGFATVLAGTIARLNPRTRRRG